MQITDCTTTLFRLTQLHRVSRLLIVGLIALGSLVLLALAPPPFGHAKAKTATPMTFTVINANGSGPGSLVQAVIDANNNPGLDTIAFNIPGAGPHTIQPTSFLSVFDPVIIDGYTQPGASPNTNPPNLGTNAVLKIELDGSITSGVLFFVGNNRVRGLVINRAPFHGILLNGGGNVIEGNFIGTDPSGTVAVGNSGYGIWVGTSSTNDLIGGTDPSARNLISGNQSSALFIGGSSGTQVLGNLIGTDRTGVVGLGNNGGLGVVGASNTTIGGTTAAARNIISANNGAGIHIYFGSSGTVVQGNYIGMDVTGTQPLGNNYVGVIVEGVGPPHVSNTLIGGTAPGAGNIIARSNGPGIVISGGALNTVVQGNSIGTDLSGALNLGNAYDGVQIFESASVIGGTAPGAGNRIAFNGGAGVNVILSGSHTILSNAIYANAGLGIDLGNNGVTPNDAGDGDTGPNNLQNFPVLTAALACSGGTVVGWTLNSTPNTTFTLEFFANAACDPAGHGEGANLLGRLTAMTDAGGNAAGAAILPATAGQFITTTATDAGGNTSEFSACQMVSANTPPVLSYADQTVAVGGTLTVNPATGPSDDGGVVSIALQTVGPPTGISVAVNPTTGQVSITNITRTGKFNIVIRARDNCGATTAVHFKLTVTD